MPILVWRQIGTKMTKSMKETCPKIRENYQFYKSMIDKEKLINLPTIHLDNKNRNWKEKIIPLKHNSHESIEFGASKKNNDPKYGLKIFIKELYEQPVFYFDSDGPAHNNHDGKTRLTDTKVKTPHINYFDEFGVKRAKRDDFIEQNESKLQIDINFGMKFFCSQSNINKFDEVPMILTEIQQKIETENIDLHDGVNFFINND